MFPMFIEKDELRNEAVVFLKPHADSDACEKMLVAGLEAAGCTIESKRRCLRRRTGGVGGISARAAATTGTSWTYANQTLT